MFEQERVLMRLQQRVARETDLVACFLTDSYGRRDADAFSDLNVVLVYPSDRLCAIAFERREAFIRDVMTFLTFKSIDAARRLVAVLYANGTKMTLHYASRDSLIPQPDYRDIYILKDSAGWAANWQIESARSSSEPAASLTITQLQELDQHFWIQWWDVYRHFRRGDFVKPFSAYLDLVQRTLPVLLYVLPAPSETRARLIEILYNRDGQGMVSHLRGLLEVYLEARQEIVAYHRLDYIVDERFESAIKKSVGIRS